MIAGNSTRFFSSRLSHSPAQPVVKYGAHTLPPPLPLLHSGTPQKLAFALTEWRLWQLRAANRADVIGRDLEGDGQVGGAMSSFGNHLTVTAERSQELNNVKDAAEIEEKARDDFESRVYDTPAAKLVGALGAFLQVCPFLAKVVYRCWKKTFL